MIWLLVVLVIAFVVLVFCPCVVSGRGSDNACNTAIDEVRTYRECGG